MHYNLWSTAKQVGEIKEKKQESPDFFAGLSGITFNGRMKRNQKDHQSTIEDFLTGKSAITISLFHHFITAYQSLGELTVYPAKTMIGVAHAGKRIAWVTQLGKNFVHVVFPFKKPYPDNLCFQKIAPVPGDAHQFNHHFRMYYKEDINEEVMEFMKLAYDREQEV